MSPWCSPAPQDRWKRILLGSALGCLLALSCVHGETSFNQSLITQITNKTRKAPGPVAPLPPPLVDPQTYLLTIRLGGKDAQATPALIGSTQGAVSEQLHYDPHNCKVVEAANITICVDGAPTPASASDMYFPPDTGPPELSAYLEELWKSTSDLPAPPYSDSLSQQALVAKQYVTSGRRLHDAFDGVDWEQAGAAARKLHQAPASSCVPQSQLTLAVSYSEEKMDMLWNATLDFFMSGRFISKMAAKNITLDNAQLLGYQEPSDASASPSPTRDGPGLKQPDDQIHTFGPQPGDQTDNSSPLEFGLEVVGDDAQVQNDSLLGALYEMIVRPSPYPGSAFLTSDNTAITVIRQGPPQNVGVALGRRRSRRLAQLTGDDKEQLLNRVRKLLQQTGPPPQDSPVDSVNAQYNVSKPSLDVTFRLRSVPVQSVLAVKDVINTLVSQDILLEGFQDRGISVYQVNLQSFSFQPAASPQPGPPAPPPYVVITTRKSSSGPRTTIIVVAVVPVSVLVILLSIFSVCWYRRQKRRNRAANQEMRMNLKMKESELSGASSMSEHYSDKPMSAAEVIREMHPPRLAQSAFLDMTWSDWKIAASELTILTRPDGSEWLLGTGATGRVYKALRNGVQIVAVKLFKEEMTRGAINSLTSPQHAEQFRREIEILKSCHDKNIVQFLGACLTGSKTILVTEYLENGDLYNAINSQQGNRYHWYRMQQPGGRPVPNSGMARRVALDVARGLHFLHTKKIVHFDLKSANILLARDYTAKIADVGLARILKDDVLSTRKEVGTFAWAAPEVLLGQRTTEAADIYSFGVLLHELSALESPSGRHLRSLKVPDECPEEVSDLIFRCLDPNPQNRPSARDLVAVLCCLPAVPAFPPPKGSKDSPSHSRHSSFSRSFSATQHTSIQELFRISATEDEQKQPLHQK